MRLAVCLPLAALLFACGTDVDLGGTEDGGPIDAGPPGAECAPCSSGSGCISGVCAQFAGDLFCGTTCSSAGQCASDQTCSSVKSSDGNTVRVCVPSSGGCAPAGPLLTADGATPDHCGTLNGPSVASSCSACQQSSSDCQPNGCYGGYWCNEASHDCGPPPTTCP
jgi:hypothetical protein